MEDEKDYGECPIHHTKLTSALICPGCLNDEHEKEEEREQEELEEQELTKQSRLPEYLY